MGTPATEPTCASAVTGAVAAASPLADGAQITEANGPFTGAATARAGADQTQAPHAVGLADLVADQASADVRCIVTKRRVPAEDGRDVRPLCHLQDPQDAGILGLL